MTRPEHRTSTPPTDSMWFDAARVLDQQWVEITVTTTSGETVHYRVPRQTMFSEIDDVASRVPIGS